jgi:hypothetical protein
VLAALLVLAGACTARTIEKGDANDAGSGVTTGPAGATDPIDELRPFEAETRRAFDFAKPPSAETGLGADPWAIRRVASGWVGILRGRSALVLLDEELRELARVPCPRSPTGLALGKNGEILVVGELSSNVARYTLRGRALEAMPEVHVPGVTGLRDVAVSPSGVLWALDERGGRLLRLGLDAKDARSSPIVTSLAVGHGASSLVATAKHVVVNAVTDHELVIFTTDGTGAPLAREPTRIRHDGPMWGFDVRETEDGLLVVAGGVEDHPLDRTSGFFGYIDSFLFAYRVRDAKVETLATLNVSEHGVVTPKAISLEPADPREAGARGRVDVLVTAYGSAAAVRVSLRGKSDPTVAALTLVPGLRALARSAERGSKAVALADPLLDAWVLAGERGAHVVPVPAIGDEAPRATASRLGEALFFTSLMAPKNTSTGALSRFTCETCHFEGYVDGRTHHTGREDIHATTKPLAGLVGNRPYFSRALDPDLSTIAHAEFRVAGAGSETDPFFAVEPRDHAWLEHVGVTQRTEPLELRRALMRFLTDLSHRPNPAAVARANGRAATFEPLEREGARLFRDRCEGCHAARLSADDAGSRVAFERWEAMILDEAAPIVWGSAGYAKTGVRPYVHDDGARTPSLRRLYKKHPYFTNGSAKSISDVLDGVRFVDDKTFHARAPGTAERLDDASKRALAAFLELL